MGSSINRVNVHHRKNGGQLFSMANIQVNGLVGQIDKEISVPVPLQTRRQERVKKGLQRRPGNRSGEVDDGLCQVPERFEDCLPFGRVSGVTEDNGARLLQVVFLREGIGRGHGLKTKISIEIRRGFQDVVPPERHHLFGFAQLPEDGPAVDGVHRMGFEEERGDHTEISSAAAQRPEEVGIFPLAGRLKAAVRQDHIRLHAGYRSSGRTGG